MRRPPPPAYVTGARVEDLITRGAKIAEAQPMAREWRPRSLSLRLPRRRGETAAKVVSIGSLQKRP